MEQSAKMRVSAYFSLDYNDGNPVDPATGEELAEVVDRIIEIGDHKRNFLTAYVKDASRRTITILDVGIQLDGSAGSIRFEGPEGSYISKGPGTIGEPITYYSYGRRILLPGNSVIDLSSIKDALINFYDRSFLRPDNIQWQDWPEEYRDQDEDCGDNELPDDAEWPESQGSADDDPWADSDPCDDIGETSPPSSQIASRHETPAGPSDS